MNYKILQENNFEKSLKQIVMENRELTKSDVDFLLNPTSEYLENPFKIKNMSEAISLFINELDNDSLIGILCDPDVDGISSSALMYLFLTNECEYSKEKIEIFFHNGKQHGLSDEKIFKQIKKSNIDFLIIPDAGSNDIHEMKELMKLGKRILVLDHHNINDEEQNTIFQDQNKNLIGVIVNNQLDEYSTSFSGVGVVWKFLSAMTETELIHYLDLVAVGNIADTMDINNWELRYVVDKGLNNIHNTFFKELLNQETMTPTDVSFNIANKMNAVCRFGKETEKRDMFRALIGEQEDFEYMPKKTKTNPNPQMEIHSLQKTMARMCSNVKTRQDKAVKTSMKKIINWIEENNANEHKVIVVINEGKENLVEKNIGGLVANKLMDIYKRPIIILHKSDEEYMGSMRGNIESFKDVLESTEIVRVIGHDNAGGVFISKKDMPRLLKRLDKAMENIEICDNELLVDCEININNINKKDFNDIYEMKKIWFSNCKEPMFLIKNIEISEKDIQQPFPTLVTFKYNGYKFDKLFASNEWISKLLHKDEKRFGRLNLSIDVIVKLNKNEYNKNGYFEIVEAESEVIEKKENKNIPF